MSDEKPNVTVIFQDAKPRRYVGAVLVELLVFVALAAGIMVLFGWK